MSALVIRWIKDNRTHSILAVDADSNVNLNDLLGISISETIGGIREEMRKSVHQIPGGMTKQAFLEYKIHTSLVETPDFDLIAMGRPEGPGCYCYANNLLRDILKTLSNNYQYVIIDSEAGMEHLSRRTTQNIDFLLIVSDPSARGIRTAGRINRLLEELNTRVGVRHLLLNRVRNPVPEELQQIISEEGLPLLATIPEDEKLRMADQTGEPVWNIPEESPIYLEIDRFMKKLL